MGSSLTGKNILSALIDLKNPANLDEIVDQLTQKNEGKIALREEVKAILDDGVRFGVIVEKENKYTADVEILDKVTNRTTHTKLYDTFSSDDDELNDHVEDCGPRTRRRKRSRSRSTKRRSSRRRRRHG